MAQAINVIITPMEITHVCIKCQGEYKDNDPDDYYCPKCVLEKQEIAKKIDAQRSLRPPKRPAKSELQIFDEISNARGSKFLNMRELGITPN